MAEAVRPRGLRNLRTAVAALLLVVVVLPGTTGGLAYWQARSLMVGEVERGQAAAVDALVSSLAWSLDLAEGSLKNAATAESLTAAVTSQDPAAVERQLRAIYTSMPLYRTLGLLDASGELVAAWPRDLTTPLPELVAGTGHKVFRARPVGVDGVMGVRVPVADGSALVAEISLSASAPLLQSFRFGDTGTATVVDDEGRVVLAGNASRRNQQLRAPEVIALASEMKPGQVRYFAPLLQRRNISSFQPVADRRLGVFVDIAESEAFGDLNRLAWVLVLLVIALSVAGLLGVLFVARRMASNERQLQRLHEAAHTQAMTDPLTSLANRRAFDDALAVAVAQSRDAGTPLAVTMFDLNSFKRLNDTRGHGAGDAALRAVANELRSCTRQDDTAARLGGDEFALLHPNCTEEVASRIADRVVDAVASLGLLSDGETGTVLTVSSGTAGLVEGFTAQDVVAAADVNLYRAKDEARQLRPHPSATPRR